MAQFISYNPDIEVAGLYVFSFINAMRRGIETRQAVLAKHGIGATDDVNTYYPYPAFLNAMKEIAAATGEMNLFIMGMAAVKNTPIQANVGLREVLEQTNKRVHSLHRLNGQPMYDASTDTIVDGLGDIKLLEFDEKGRRAVVISNTAYPTKTEEGVLTARLQLYRPKDSDIYDVKEDITKERKSQGADSTTFLLRW